MIDLSDLKTQIETGLELRHASLHIAIDPATESTSFFNPLPIFYMLIVFTKLMPILIPLINNARARSVCGSRPRALAVGVAPNRPSVRPVGIVSTHIQRYRVGITWSRQLKYQQLKQREFSRAETRQGLRNLALLDEVKGVGSCHDGGRAVCASSSRSETGGC